MTVKSKKQRIEQAALDIADALAAHGRGVRAGLTNIAEASFVTAMSEDAVEFVDIASEALTGYAALEKVLVEALAEIHPEAVSRLIAASREGQK